MKILKRLFFSIIIIFSGLYISGKIYSVQPPLVTRSIVADTQSIKKDLLYLTKECHFRNYKHPGQLQKAADYIYSEFKQVSANVEVQKYNWENYEFSNIICSFGPRDAERIIIGAHYDACGDQEGADDNASGTCGILELVRLLKDQPLKYRIDIVAYSSEEPPFFGTNFMGSYVHAKSLHDAKVKVKGMVCLEMIGVYFNETGTQDYPAFFLRWFYGNRGNFITVTQKTSNGNFGRFFRKRMKKEQVIPTKSFTVPQWVGGIDLSDHRNYWKLGYSAVMVTNTAFYRNKNYHTTGDIAEQIDIYKMSLVIDEVYRTILDTK